MALQARFGTDSRFQVDSRFLESDDEDQGNLFKHVLGFECVWKKYSPTSVFQISDAADPEKNVDEQLLEEKKKSLDILQSILNINVQPQNTRKGKMFKYDFFRCSLNACFGLLICF